jgi:HD-GYP domain-containing protein (c-di-GMP phosphodiesterase class II)
VRRAALVHDLGRTGIPNTIWDKPGPLTASEWERVRLHPYYTERALARPEALARLGVVAAAHHERLDGSGYHRTLAAASLSPAARLLAAADAYHAMTEPRPHRPALEPAAAAAELRAEVRAGRLAGDAAEAVLGAAGHRVHVRRRSAPAGLTQREVEVLVLLARGASNKEIARALVIAEKTASSHVQHIYAKLDVSSRAAASLCAMRFGLLDTLEPLAR